MTISKTLPPYRIPIKATPSRPYCRRHDSFAGPAVEDENFSLTGVPSKDDCLSENFSVTVVPPKPLSSRPRNTVKVVYTSPRITEEDDKLFPTDHSRYRKEKRWESISEQAGPHRQDWTVLTINRKLTPQALKNGMTKQVASRVRSLNLWLDHNEDILPQWLDVLATLFPYLEHLTLSEDIFPGEDELAVSARMRRLYVLSRLPYLKSIDEMPVTRAERKLARPNDPDGGPVKRNGSLLDDDKEEEENEKASVEFSKDEKDKNNQENKQCEWMGCGWEESEKDSVKSSEDEDKTNQENKRDEWMGCESLLDGDDEGGEENEKDGVESSKDEDKTNQENKNKGELPLIPAVESMGNHTARELGVELNHEFVRKIAEMQQQNDDNRSDEDLAGESFLEDILQMSTSGSGEQREDYDSNNDVCGAGNRDTNLRTKSPQEVSPNKNDGNAVEVDLTEAIQRILSEKETEQNKSDSNNNGTQRQIPPIKVDVHEDEAPSSRSPSERRTRLLINDLGEHFELISVASSSHEWLTAACGVRACAPALRLAFFGRGRKQLTDGSQLLDGDDKRIKAKQALREKLDQQAATCPPPPPPVKRGVQLMEGSQFLDGDDKRVKAKQALQAATCPPPPPPVERGVQLMEGSQFLDGDGSSKRIKVKQALCETLQKETIPRPPPPVQRHSSIISPTAGCDSSSVGNSQSQFFPENEGTAEQSANQKCPPSRSLSSPFPMQFRERTKPLNVSTEVKNEDLKLFDNPGGNEVITTIKGPVVPKAASPTLTNETKQAATKPTNKIRGLPPTCPGRRKVVVSMSPMRSKKTRRQLRQLKASKKARSNSVLDNMDEEDDDSEDDDDVVEEEGIELEQVEVEVVDESVASESSTDETNEDGNNF